VVLAAPSDRSLTDASLPYMHIRNQYYALSLPRWSTLCTVFVNCMSSVYILSFPPYVSLSFCKQKNIKRDTQGDFKLRTPLKKDEASC
jgi:hypothetical protein